MGKQDHTAVSYRVYLVAILLGLGLVYGFSYLKKSNADIPDHYAQTFGFVSACQQVGPKDAYFEFCEREITR